MARLRDRVSRALLCAILGAVVCILCIAFGGGNDKIIYAEFAENTLSTDAGTVSTDVENSLTNAPIPIAQNAQTGDAGMPTADTVIEEREIQPVEMDLVLYLHLMYVRDGVYPDENSENLLKTTDFVNLTELDLRDVRDGDLRMQSVEGLGLFDFSALRSLNLADNNLVEVPASTFDGMVALDYLNVEGNNLELLEIGGLDSIGELYASGNSLQEVDLTNLVAGGVADLSFNQISDITLLNLDVDGQGTTLDLYNNCLTNFVADDYTNYNMIVGLQRLVDVNQYNEHTVITNFKYGEQNYYLECVNIANDSIINIYDTATLPPATYNIYYRTSEGYVNYQSVQIRIYKTAPTVIITNEDGEELGLENTITENVCIYFDSNDENYEVVYTINGGPPVKSSYLEINRNGTYSFTVRAISDIGDESQTYSFTIKVSANSGNLLQILSIMFSVLILVGLIYLVLVFFVWRTNKRK